MSSNDDDKPTVVLDLAALKKLKLKQSEELDQAAQDLEFITATEDSPQAESLKVILFDYKSDLFKSSLNHLGTHHQFDLASELGPLNKMLASKTHQVIAFNFDVEPKSISHLVVQIKKKFPELKILLIAKKISPSKAKQHAQTPAGAHGYYQLPFEAQRFEEQLQEIIIAEKKVG
jgi:DNA-binding NtrC family response regulator